MAEKRWMTSSITGIKANREEEDDEEVEDTMDDCTRPTPVRDGDIPLSVG
jgi:hypothetical protein